MAKYKIVIKKPAEKFLAGIPIKFSDKIVLKIYELGANPRPQGVKKLAGGDNLYRVRVADYRIVYSIHDQVLTVEIIRIGHRKDVYDF
jgi:mRNA interferase RelE/StbE